MLHKIIRGIAPVAAMAFAAGLAGCDGGRVVINDGEGVPLSELDLSGAPPTELVLAGPDHVLLAKGRKLAIDVSGDQAAIDALRFTLKDGALGIMRDHEARKIEGRATVRVTMPLPEKIVIAGSGKIETEGLADIAEMVIAGSGTVSANDVSSKSLQVTVAGSGLIDAAGTVETLELNIAGSGNARMRALKADTAEIMIAGSGTADFSSDGTVTAKIVGSGDVKVTGSATCKVNAVGSGTVTCQAAPNAAEAQAEPSAKASKPRRKPGASGPARA